MTRIKGLSILISNLLLLNLLVPTANVFAKPQAKKSVSTVTSPITTKVNITGSSSIMIPDSSISKSVTLSAAKTVTMLATVPVKNQKTCTQIGMIANDPLKASSNYTLLINEINAGTKILVDNKYSISGESKAAPVITKNINIEGVTENAEFSLNNTKYKYIFNIQAKKINVQKVKFTQNSDGCVTVFTVNNGQKIDKFVIENCYFEGRIRLVTWSFLVNSVIQFIDPTATDYGIIDFAFNYNTVKNITATFMLLLDVPINHAQLIGNNINNFAYVFYNQGVTNENPYKAQVAERMRYLEVRNNVVKNDPSWNGMPKLQTYHCFVLFEGNKCDYIQNHIEGLHVLDQTVSVYDAYLSCWVLTYENNYWKNNICFSPSKIHADLMKSKNANTATTDYHGLTRVYRNNTFIVEKSYADLFGRSYDELWVSLGEYSREMETVVVENNIFDVYKLGKGYKQLVHNYTFANNDLRVSVTVDSIEKYLVPIRMVSSPVVTDTFIAKDNCVDSEMSPDYDAQSLQSAVARLDKIYPQPILFENNVLL
jgi:hypothetical protein